jgi:hypothetical protein
VPAEDVGDLVNGHFFSHFGESCDGGVHGREGGVRARERRGGLGGEAVGSAVGGGDGLVGEVE